MSFAAESDGNGTQPSIESDGSGTQSSIDSTQTKAESDGSDQTCQLVQVSYDTASQQPQYVLHCSKS